MPQYIHSAEEEHATQDMLPSKIRIEEKMKNFSDKQKLEFQQYWMYPKRIIEGLSLNGKEVRKYRKEEIPLGKANME